MKSVTRLEARVGTKYGWFTYLLVRLGLFTYGCFYSKVGAESCVRVALGFECNSLLDYPEFLV